MLNKSIFLSFYRRFRRYKYFLAVDSLLICASLYFSFLLRFEFVIDDLNHSLIINALPFFVIVKLTAFWIFGVYRFTWRFVGLHDLYNIMKALFVSSVLLMLIILISTNYPILVLNSFFSFRGFPKSVFIIDLFLSMGFIMLLRVSKRLFLETFNGHKQRDQGVRTIIIGAGNTGEMILRDMLRDINSDYCPVGFLDDDQGKRRTYIHGVKVLGPTGKLRGAVRKYKADAIIIAIPFLNYTTLRNIYQVATESKVGIVKIVPRIYEFHKPDINLKSLEDISVEDLLGRQAIRINYEEIGRLLKDKVIIVTGAGGSIGSEISRQVCSFIPRKIIFVDNDETELHNIELKLKRQFPYLDKMMHYIVGDIRDLRKIEQILHLFNPEILFHAAAYKHVPILEHNPEEAVKVNIIGTSNLVKAAIKNDVKKFIMISTDKAVLPKSVMGATKRIAENICRAYNNIHKTEFVSVRFGNVLGSRGSVLPLFLDQLKKGGPLTITHKDMQRYFMTIPEAVSLVLQASVIGQGGEVLVLDMGEPVIILKMAEDLIKLHGLQPYKDIDIHFIGLRPGENLFEELLTSEEETVATKHERIYIARAANKFNIDQIEDILDEFNDILHNSSYWDTQGLKDTLKKHVNS